MTRLISKYYLEQQQIMHRIRPGYGTSGYKYVDEIIKLSKNGKKSVLDYGCGKMTLDDNIPFIITNFDPCIPGLDNPPEPHDIIVCTDVLEHIELQFLDDVLADIRRLMKRRGFFTISYREAGKDLPDGRNAHLIVENEEWWTNRIIGANFEILERYLEEDDDTTGVYIVT